MVIYSLEYWNCGLGFGHVVEQLVEALHYKPQGREFDSRWYHWKFSLTWSFRPHSGHGVDSASNRNEYQEYFLWGKGSRYVGLITLLPSCADCLEIWEPQTPGTLRACPGLPYWSAYNASPTCWKWTARSYWPISYLIIMVITKPSNIKFTALLQPRGSKATHHSN